MPLVALSSFNVKTVFSLDQRLSLTKVRWFFTCRRLRYFTQGWTKAVRCTRLLGTSFYVPFFTRKPVGNLALWTTWNYKRRTLRKKFLTSMKEGTEISVFHIRFVDGFIRAELLAACLRDHVRFFPSKPDFGDIWQCTSGSYPKPNLLYLQITFMSKPTRHYRTKYEELRSWPR